MQNILLSGARILLVIGLSPWLCAQYNPQLPGNGQTQKVVAEGVGATADEALKDAFRNAVQHVVGAVVDAETLVENDKIIADKVLSYSNGFITSFDEVLGSKTLQGGLHRIKIKAQVERRSVIAKLKAADVTMKAFDGKGLFAEVVTQLDAEKDAASILQRQFRDFPQSCITATVKGKPEVTKKRADGADVRIIVQVVPDLKAYKAFSARVIPILGQLATNKSQFTAVFEKSTQNEVPYLYAIGKNRGIGDIALFADWVPKSFDGRGLFRNVETLTLAVASNRTKQSDKIEYKVFQLDPVLRQLLAEIASRCGKGKLTLRDSSGESVASERFDLTESDGWGNKAAFAGTLIAAFGSGMHGVYEMKLTRGKKHGAEIESARSNAQFFIVSPTFFASNYRLAQLPQLSIPIDLTLSLDELKSVHDTKVEITFDE
ncbi:MAG: hypothetical protein SGI77_11860 [Pirellulaceae bacterium]|nr:hypothetical protein [Pirellulaceae bacterium]